MKIIIVLMLCGRNSGVKHWEISYDFLQAYNISDVLLLDEFENFRDVCVREYGLDPAWYYTAPELAWDAELKYTAVELELLSDPGILLMLNGAQKVE